MLLWDFSHSLISPLFAHTGGGQTNTKKQWTAPPLRVALALGQNPTAISIPTTSIHNLTVFSRSPGSSSESKPVFNILEGRLLIQNRWGTHTGHFDVVCGSVEEPHLDLGFPCVHRIYPSSSLGRLSSNTSYSLLNFFYLHLRPLLHSSPSASSSTSWTNQSSVLLDNKVLHTCTPTRINAFFGNLIKNIY